MPLGDFCASDFQCSYRNEDIVKLVRAWLNGNTMAAVTLGVSVPLFLDKTTAL